MEKKAGSHGSKRAVSAVASAIVRDAKHPIDLIRLIVRDEVEGQVAKKSESDRLSMITLSN